MPDSYRRKLSQRTRGILRGRIELAAAVVGLLVVFSRPVMDYLLSVWEGLPWWVGLFILTTLVSYALVRAGYELWKEEEQARKKAQATISSGESPTLNSSLLSELQSIRAERDEANKKLKAGWWKEGAFQQLTDEIKELKAERDRLKPDADRMRLRHQLGEAIERGKQFLGPGQPIEEDVQSWHASNLRLIKENLGDEMARSYSQAPGEVPANPPRTPQQERIARRIRWLEEILDKAVDYQRPPSE